MQPPPIRAALGEMQKIRSTDRLVDIVVVQPRVASSAA